MRSPGMYFIIISAMSFFLLSPLPASGSDFPVKRGERPPVDLDKVSPEAYEPGRILVKIGHGYDQYIEDKVLSAAKGDYVKTGIYAVDELNRRFSAGNYRPLLGNLYTKSSKSLQRRELHEAWGFHRWFEVEIDSKSDIIEAVRNYSGLDEIEIAEPVYRKRSIAPVPVPETYLSQNVAKSGFPDDPYYDEQWHYNNTGQRVMGKDGEPGVDISLEAAWQQFEKGRPDVIVAIFDDGMDFIHEDLAANVWEDIGPEGENTQVDDHATHVAGTVAAVTNNSKGVAGIAGGTGEGDGVRLMTVDILGGEHGWTDLALYTYAADNGAAISQNSWGYTESGVYNQSALDGIDYFNTYGGGEALIGGGITIFAAGNDDDDGDWYPAYYEGAMAVASYDNQGRKSGFSNYGEWIDISAPGTGVMSTVPGNSYSLMSGTSMACPHVSGVAALVLSNVYGLLGPQDLWDILVDNVDDIYQYNNEQYQGKLGSGGVNAYEALMAAQEFLGRVAGVQAFSATPDGHSHIDLSWVKNDDDHDVMIIWSEDGVFGTPEDETVYIAGEAIIGGGTVLYRGSDVTYRHSGREPDTRYYYRSFSYDADNNYSLGRDATAVTDRQKHLVAFNVQDTDENPLENVMIIIAPGGNNDKGDVFKTSGKSADDVLLMNRDLTVQERDAEIKIDHNDLPKSYLDEDGTWIHWDDGVFAGAIGIDANVIFTVASRWEPSDIAEFDGQFIRKLKFFIGDIPISTTAKIWQGPDENGLVEVYSQEFTPVELSWVEVNLAEPYKIDISQELWFGYEIEDPGSDVYPAGRDQSTDHDGKGNKVRISTNDWTNLSELNNLTGDWMIRAFLIEPDTLYTDGSGSVSIEKYAGTYYYTAGKEDYSETAGNFTVDDEPLQVNIVLVPADAGLPAVTTLPVSDITATTAASGGEVTDDGSLEVTARGVVWSTEEDPSLIAGEHDGFTEDGTGIGEFVSELTDLDPGTTYYVRAYATNSEGTAYGQEEEFTTEAGYTYNVTFNVVDEASAPIADAKITVIPRGMENTGKAVMLPVKQNDEQLMTTAQEFGGLAVSGHKSLSPVGYEAPAGVTGEWFNWDSGENHNVVGLTASGSFSIASRWEPEDLTGYDGMYISLVSFFPASDNCDYTMKLWDEAGKVLYSQEINEFTSGRWNIVSLDTVFLIDASQELWIGFNLDQRGSYPAGADQGPAIAWKGDLLNGGDGWFSMSEQTAYNYNWNLQAYAVDIITLYTDDEGLAGFEAAQSSYSYVVEKDGYNDVSGDFNVEESDLDINVQMESEVGLPHVTTSVVTGITQTTATTGGEVTDDGGAEVTTRGVVWGTEQDPTLDENEGYTEDGTGIGEFVSELTDLDPGTTYYVRAYATNSKGTGYGQEVEFTTLEDDSLIIPGDGVTDIDDNFYNTVIIGNQEWMAKNLRVTRYKNGDAISTGLNDTDWSNADSDNEGAYAIYPHDNIEGLNTDAEVVEVYGKLYNWYAVDDERGLCPAGWWVPTDDEWKTLEGTVDSQYNVGDPEWDEIHGRGHDAGKKLKAISGWDHGGSGTDDFGFSAVPGGQRSDDGEYALFGAKSKWWVASKYLNWALDRSVAHFSDLSIRGSSDRRAGFSVRCVRDVALEITVPAITTAAVSDITQTTATTGGKVNDDGGAEVTTRGVVWGTEQDPTLDENEGYTEDGTGIGEFVSELTDLVPGTTYYVRAYATNSEGTSYGDQVEFTTLAIADPDAPDGTGSDQDPYLIETLEHLLWIYENPGEWDKHYRQVADIDASETEHWNDGQGWQSIGFSTSTGSTPWDPCHPDESFTGTYDGNNKSIKGLYINRSGIHYQGFFGCLLDATVINLGLSNVNFTGGHCLGGLSGQIDGSYIYGSYVSGSVSGDYQVGGLVGRVSDAGEISECYSTADVSGGNNVGGLVGTHSGTSAISNSYSRGSVTGSPSPSGGTGGWVGGLAGIIAGTGAVVDRSFSTGEVIASGSPVGGLVGRNDNIVTNSYWDKETSGRTSSAGGTGLTTEQMTYPYGEGAYEDWDFNLIWNHDEDKTVNDGYPYLLLPLDETPIVIPAVTTASVADITQTTATSGGEVTDDGGAEVTVRGVVWGTDQDPTLDQNDGLTEDGTGTGEFVSELTGLIPETTYYVRAYATNSEGTAYGQEEEFTTEQVYTYNVTFDVFDEASAPIADAKITVIPRGMENAGKAVMLIGKQNDDHLITTSQEFGGLEVSGRKSLSPVGYEAPAGLAGEWFSWDSGENHNVIGLTASGSFSIASRWEPEDLTGYDGMYISLVSFFPASANCDYTLRLWDDAGNVLYSQDVNEFNSDRWNIVSLDTPFMIDASEELWFGFDLDQRGSYPAGADQGPAIAWKGDLLNGGGGWFSMSEELGSEYNYNWNLQAYAVNVVTLYTDADGLAGFEAAQGTYSYIVEKEGYHNASDNFSIEDSGLLIDVMLESDVSYVIDDISPEMLNIYPNPASNFIIIESEKLLRELRVLDISGQAIMQYDVNTYKRELAVGSLPTGVYLLRVELEPGGEVVIRRFVIAR